MGRRLNVWKIIPSFSRRRRVRRSSSSAASSTPSSLIEPEVGWSRPQIRLRSVDFPEPDGPITATRSPCSTVMLRLMQSLHGPAVPVGLGDICQLDHGRGREHPEMAGQRLKRELILPQG